MARKSYNILGGVTFFKEVMVDPAGPVVNNSCNQTTTAPKWIIIFFSRSVLKEARIWFRGGYSA